MRVQSVLELGALARDARRRQGLTQAEVAVRAAVGRDVVGRFERGHARLELRAALDILAALALELVVEERSSPDGTGGRDDDDLYDDAYEETY